MKLCFYFPFSLWYHLDVGNDDMQILDTASLLYEGSKGVKKNIFNEQSPQPDSTSTCC